MPLILAFIIQNVLPILASIFVLLLAALVPLIKFTIARLPKIPLYIQLLMILYADMKSSVRDRQIITGGLLILSSVLTFMTYSLIPFTGIPLIGAITTPIAATLAFVVELTLLDIIFNLNKGYYIQYLQEKGFAEINDIEDDINILKFILGDSWKKLLDTINNGAQKIYNEGTKRGLDPNDRDLQNYVNNKIEGLVLYIKHLSNESQQTALNSDLWKQNNNIDWTKEVLSFSTSATLGTLTGVGTSAVASSIFVKASMRTALQGLLGISTGVVVNATMYSLLTAAAPAGLGIVATLGIYSGLMNLKNREQAAKKSKFLAEIIIAALPMAWIDGRLDEREKDTIDRLYAFFRLSGVDGAECLIPAIIWQAMEKQQAAAALGWEWGQIFQYPPLGRKSLRPTVRCD